MPATQPTQMRHIAPRWMPEHDRDDIAQEALTRAVARGVDTGSTAWLRTVARRVAIDRLRASRELPSGTGADLDGLSPLRHAGPEEEVLAAESRTEVRRAMSALPPRYREALELSLDGGAADVATRFGISAEAAWTLMSRARGRLRKELDRIGYVPAVFLGKLQRWAEPMAAGGVAVGLAVTIGLSGQSPVAPAPEPARETIAAARAPEPIAVPAAAGPVADVVTPRAPLRVEAAAAPEVPVPPVTTTPLRATGQICSPAPGSDDEGIAELEFIDDQKRSASQHVVPIVPESLQQTDTTTQECS